MPSIYAEYVEDIRLIVPGRPVVILRYWKISGQWIVYFEVEANRLAKHDGVSRTPEEALEKFIKYRINGEEPDNSQWKLPLWERQAGV